MQKRKLGNSNIEIAPLALGGNVFDWTADQKTSHAVLDAFLDAGFNCVDTANAYSTWVSGHKGGESETVIGTWLKKRGGRDKVVIATKIGAPMGDGGKGLAKDYIANEVEASLKRLQTDYIDLYQSHYDDEATPIEETMRAFGKLIEQGKVRAIGASNFSVPRLAQSLETSKRLRGRAGGAVREREHRRHPLLRIGGGIPYRQVSQRGRSREERARTAQRQEIHD
jgi:aryl-alcohol dehydrogenase-like predicted oxidoreductase